MVFTQDLMPIIAILLLIATIWSDKQAEPNERPADACSLRKRANGVDVGEFEIVCENLKVDKKRVLPRELAIVKSFLADDLNALKRIHFETRSYRDGEI